MKSPRTLAHRELVPTARIFLSHSTEEAGIATHFKTWLQQKCSAQLSCFQSSDATSIAVGERWFDRICTEIQSSDLLLTLLSPNSIRNRWINIETGMAIAANRRIAPLLVLGLQVNEVPDPWQPMQLVDLKRNGHLSTFIELIKPLSFVVERKDVELFRDSLLQRERVTAVLATLDRLTRKFDGRTIKQQITNSASRGSRICFENVPPAVLMEITVLRSFYVKEQLFEILDIHSTRGSNEKFDITLRLDKSIQGAIQHSLVEI